MRVQYRVVLTLILVFLVGLPLAGCSSERKEVLAYLEAAQPILNEWSDTFNRATSTARVSLSPVIGDLQRVKRDYEALEPPEPCLQAHVQVIDSMDY
ncbi:MAG: hypothetical protein GX601_07945 [Anaerolineales bacterium]|nr:hypothetical protein [Anaerolineales bacterium]